MDQNTKLRVARPTDNMQEVLQFYRDGLGLDVLGHFEDHDGFDGVMLGKNNAPYHLEFTSKSGHSAGKAPTEDNLLIFYFPILEKWKEAVAQMESAGFQSVASFNPYWDKCGITFEDVDGYRVVLANIEWNK